MSDFEFKHKQSAKRLVNCEVEDDIFITGVSGIYPKCATSELFIQNLIDQKYLFTPIKDNDDQNLPKELGRVHEYGNFDIGFFGVQRFEAKTMDPIAKYVLMKTIESIMDAGLNPKDLKGSRTGVFIGACCVENELLFFSEFTPKSCLLKRNIKSFIANNISYFLEFNGPCHMLDAACTSGMFAFEAAYRAIREDKCDRAIVSACSICAVLEVTEQFLSLGILNNDSGCRPFDEHGSGYTRAEAVVNLVLQKRKEANRCYAKVIHCKINIDGFKKEGIMHPSRRGQTALLKDIYAESEIHPSELAYVETHGSGTKVGDPEEISAYAAVLAREQPLLIGSHKGNIGHTEAASSLCSITKVIGAMESGIIPGTYGYKVPRKDLFDMLTNQFKVFGDCVQWPDDKSIVGVNCIGLAGTNGHLLLERNMKIKQKQYDNKPRIVCLSGRTEKAVNNFFNILKANPLDYELIWLMQNAFRQKIDAFMYRGFIILDNKQEIFKSTQIIGVENKLQLLIGNCAKYSLETIKQFMIFDSFSSIFHKIKEILIKYKLPIDLERTNGSQHSMYTLCMYLGLLEMFKLIKLKINMIKSYSFGALIQAYYDNVISLEDCILIAYSINSDNSVGKIKNISKKIKEMTNKENGGNAIEQVITNILSKINENITNDAIILNFDQSFSSRNRKIKMFDVSSSTLNVTDLLITIGRLYENGFELDLQNLYPKIPLPVSRGTPMLNSKFEWKITHDPILINKIKDAKLTKVRNINCTNQENKFYLNYIIEGENMFPASGYLNLVLEFFSQIITKHKKPKLQFENVQFLKSTNFNELGILDLHLQMTKQGMFEISDNEQLLVTGQIAYIDASKVADIFEGNSNCLKDMMAPDIYKEMRIRGYKLSEEFCAIEEIKNNIAHIKWEGNVVTFIDNMIQFQQLNFDRRDARVPLAIESLYIDALQLTRQREHEIVPVQYDNRNHILKAPFIEIRGLKYIVKARKEFPARVLETYKFMPNNGACSLEESLRINIQIAVENNQSLNVHIEENIGNSSSHPLSLQVYKIFKDLPIFEPTITVVASRNIAHINDDIKIVHKSENSNNNLIYIAHNILANQYELSLVHKKITAKGFLICCEDADTNTSYVEGFDIYTQHKVDNKMIYMLRQKHEVKHDVVVDISNINNLGDWLQMLKHQMYLLEHVVIVAQNSPTSGILGFVNCIRQEPNGDKFRCVFIQDANAPKFDLTNKYYKDQLDKDFAINVLSNKQWGTYRHFKLPETATVQSDHYYLARNNLEWMQGWIDIENKKKSIINVHYGAIHARHLINDTAKNRLQSNELNCFEFAGVKNDGHLVMGVKCCPISNMVEAHGAFLLNVPSNWNLAAAATIPVAYMTSIYALLMKGNLRAGQSVVINCGATDVELAAINLCVHYKCKLFIIINSEEKRKLLLRKVAHLSADFIRTSYDAKFVECVLQNTNYKGADIIMNCLPNEKHQFNLVKCLAKGGCLIDIEKHDLIDNNSHLVEIIGKGATYKSLNLNELLQSNEVILSNIRDVINDGIKKGFVKPLENVIFKQQDVDKAYKFLSDKESFGKVLINLDKKTKKICNVKQRFYCRDDLSYIVIGGLGGLGMELIDWLILRGAKHIICVSRRGITTSYQTYRINLWKSYGVNFVVSNEKVTTLCGTDALINTANKIAPIGGIINLAVVLRDDLLVYQTDEKMWDSILPKAIATEYLDKISRKLCPKLHAFICFSSIIAGRGMGKVSNYGLGNSVMERICEQRRAAGLPAVSIQWGGIADVGILTEISENKDNKMVVCGTSQQKIAHCLESLDLLLTDSSNAIVCCMVVASKCKNDSSTILESICKLMGIKDIKTVGLNIPLTELGMDSIVSAEISNILEKNYSISMSIQELRNVTLSKLNELQQQSGEKAE